MPALFDAVLGWAARCRFTDCQHADEPGCAVQAAVAAGELEVERLHDWRRLRRAQAHDARRADVHAQRELQRSRAKLYRSVMRAKRGGKRRG